MTNDNRVWFITGVSSGLGRALAEAVLAKSDSVIGTLQGDAVPRLRDRETTLTTGVRETSFNFARRHYPLLTAAGAVRTASIISAVVRMRAMCGKMNLNG